MVFSQIQFLFYFLPCVLLIYFAIPRVARNAARRELAEETGYTSTRWTALGVFVTNANQGCSSAHLFIAERCRHEGPPTHPDIEAPALMVVPRASFWSIVTPADVGLASHLALMALATHPAFGAAGLSGP